LFVKSLLTASLSRIIHYTATLIKGNIGDNCLHTAFMTFLQTNTTLRIFLLFFAVCISSCTSVEQTMMPINDDPNQHHNRYTTLINEIKDEPVLTAVSELRQLVVLTDRHTSGALEEDINQRQFEAIEAEKWLICLDIANEALAISYASISSHYGAMVCSLESSNTPQGLYHQSVMNQLLEAVWTTGDGETLQTAFQVINRADRNAFIEFHGLELLAQNITHLDGQEYYIVTLYDALKDETFEWYFTQLK